MTHMSDHLRVAKAANLAEDRQARAAKPKEKTPPPTQSVKRPHRPGQLSAEQMAARLADMQVLGPVSKYCSQLTTGLHLSACARAKEHRVCRALLPLLLLLLTFARLRVCAFGDAG